VTLTAITPVFLLLFYSRSHISSKFDRPSIQKCDRTSIQKCDRPSTQKPDRTSTKKPIAHPSKNAIAHPQKKPKTPAVETAATQTKPASAG
jgi:hypothetical protein